MVVQILLVLLTFYALMVIFFKLLTWLDTHPPEVPEVKGLCSCRVDYYAGVQGHCRHKTLRAPAPVSIDYVPRHAALVAV